MQLTPIRTLKDGSSELYPYTLSLPIEGALMDNVQYFEGITFSRKIKISSVTITAQIPPSEGNAYFEISDGTGAESTNIEYLELVNNEEGTKRTYNFSTDLEIGSDKSFNLYCHFSMGVQSPTIILRYYFVE